MVHYKLTYFNIRGRAEPIRIIFAYLGLPYEDYRIEKKDWPNVKSTFPWGQVPVLQVDDVTLCQTLAIERFLARKYGLTGANELETTKCDEYVDAIEDLVQEWKKIAHNSDEAKKVELKETFLNVHAPKCLNKLSALKTSNEGSLWLVGQSITWADLVIAAILDRFETMIDPSFLDSYPVMKALKQRVFSIPKVKEYVDIRPPA
jgi:glutathione S-transferase